jgi:co-chaperonin GroES (HSP10)
MTRASKPLRVADRPAAEPAESLLAYESLQEAFPEVDEPFKPYGDKVLLQLRSAMRRTKGGIIVPDEARDAELWNTQVGKVIRLGPVAFCNRDTLQPWPEREIDNVRVGVYVRCPLYGGDRWFVPIPGSTDKALFVVFRDVDLVGEVPEHRVLDTVAYIMG